MTEELIGESNAFAAAPTSTGEALNNETVETSALKGDSHLGASEVEVVAEAESVKQTPNEDKNERSPHDPVKVSVTVHSTHSQAHKATATDSHTPPPSRPETPSTATASLSMLEQAREHVNDFLKKSAVTLQKDKLRMLLNDYDSLKDKVSKLKSLLGRSAKAQRACSSIEREAVAVDGVSGRLGGGV